MKILVALKQVPSTDLPFRVRADRRWIDEEDLSFEINEPDAYALEAGLQLKQQHGDEVVAVCAGPARASKAIREALAKGADRAIHIQEEEIERADALLVAQLLAKTAQREAPDLILTGLQSADLGAGQTGVVLAELLGWPHATIIVQIEKTPAGIRVRRELEAGFSQFIQMPLPAVLTIQSGISKLRYATLMGIKRARSKPVQTFTAAELGVEPEPGLTLVRLYRPPHTRRTQMLEGHAAEAAAKLVERLKFEARAL